MCGESPSKYRLLVFHLGSPPHVWGKLGMFSGAFIGCRITPTCVGKASKIALAHEPFGDHPHMCGESNKHE